MYINAFRKFQPSIQKFWQVSSAMTNVEEITLVTLVIVEETSLNTCLLYLKMIQEIIDRCNKSKQAS